VVSGRGKDAEELQVELYNRLVCVTAKMAEYGSAGQIGRRSALMQRFSED